MQAKRNDGLEEPTLQKLQMTCDRVLEFAEADGLFVLDSITLVHLTNWKWDRYFGTVNSLRANQEHKNWRNFSRRHARIHQDHGKKLCEMGEGAAGPAGRACDWDLEFRLLQAELE